jgi:hypothetical protein
VLDALRWPSTLDWGDVPGWIGLIAAGIAAAIALRTYQQSVTVRAEAQARLVYATREEPSSLRRATNGLRATT